MSADKFALLNGYVDNPNYSRIPGAELARKLRHRLLRVDINKRSAGDIALLAWGGGIGQHVGILRDQSHLIHAYNEAGKVVVSTLSGGLLTSLHSVYRFRQLSSEECPP